MSAHVLATALIEICFQKDAGRPAQIRIHAISTQSGKVEGTDVAIHVSDVILKAHKLHGPNLSDTDFCKIRTTVLGSTVCTSR